MVCRSCTRAFRPNCCAVTALTPEEKVQLLRITKEHAGGRPVMPGIGTNSLAGTLANLALVAPLVAAGVLSPDASLSCFSLTGYSGGGKKMIAEYESPARDGLFSAPRQYGLSQSHKHLPEMRVYGGLSSPPIFCPIVAPYYAGMEVTIPIDGKSVAGGIDAIKGVYRTVYAGGLIRYAEGADENGFLSAAAFAGRDDMQVTVCGNEERILLISRFDNLGKGASGAAIQNMNLVLGCDEKTGLVCS